MNKRDMARLRGVVLSPSDNFLFRLLLIYVETSDEHPFTELPFYGYSQTAARARRSFRKFSCYELHGYVIFGFEIMNNRKTPFAIEVSAAAVMSCLTDWDTASAFLVFFEKAALIADTF